MPWFVGGAIALHGWNEMEMTWPTVRRDHYPLGSQGFRTSAHQVQGESPQGLVGVTCPVLFLGWEDSVLLMQ